MVLTRMGWLREQIWRFELRPYHPASVLSQPQHILTAQHIRSELPHMQQPINPEPWEKALRSTNDHAKRVTLASDISERL